MKVKLLKDLPDIKAGAIFAEDDKKKNDFFYKYRKFGREINFSFNRDTIIANRGWFSEFGDYKEEVNAANEVKKSG